MAGPPFSLDKTNPAPPSLISTFPANEQANRATIEDWLAYISDPTTGMIREAVLPGSGFAAGTKMLFAQTAAPTGWTKDTTHNNKALRLVSGTAGSGGTGDFTTVFASRTPVGTIGGTVSTGTVGGTVSTGTVGGTALTTAQLPSHTHSISGSGTTTTEGAHTHSITGYRSTSGTTAGTIGTGQGTAVALSTNSGGSHNHDFSFSGTSGAQGSGASHTHTLTMNSHTHTLTMDSHNHTFTGTAMDFAVAYVDVIIATRN